MARRSDHTHEEIKAMAVQAGRTLLAEKGFPDFSARAVATQIGYSVGTLYNVFGDYDGLMLHIHAQILDEWYAFMQNALPTETPMDKQLQALGMAYIDFAEQHYNSWASLFEYRFKGEKLPEWYDEKMERFFALVETVLHPVFGQNSAQCERAAKTLWAGIHGICVLSLSGKLDAVGVKSARQLAGAFITHYIVGLKHSLFVSGG